MARTCSSASQRWEELAPIAHYRAPELAEACQISVRQLERRFRQELERSPQDWLDELRILAAQQQLLSGEQEKNVVSALGFKQESHFCRQFKSWTGMTPTEFLALHLHQPGTSLMDNRMSLIDNIIYSTASGISNILEDGSIIFGPGMDAHRISPERSGFGGELRTGPWRLRPRPDGLMAIGWVVLRVDAKLSL